MNPLNRFFENSEASLNRFFGREPRVFIPVARWIEEDRLDGEALVRLALANALPPISEIDGQLMIEQGILHDWRKLRELQAARDSR